MATLKDRKNKQVNPIENTVLQITGHVAAETAAKKKYAVNVIFDGKMEDAIRKKAAETGLGVATYIRTLVIKDLDI